MRSAYIRILRALRSALAATGLLGLLDRRVRRSRTALWVRSWFAVYDLDDLIALDVPWWTFAASDRVAQFLRGHPDARVFEWGSGASTVWLAARGGGVTSVEHDEAWAVRMRTVMPGTAELLLAAPTPADGATRVWSRKPGFAGLDFAAYVDSIDGVPGEFDLIVIDGRAREACLAKALPRLAPGGVVVFDNVERARYRAAIAHELARDPHLRGVWTSGRTPALPYPTRTALITRGPG